MADTPLPEPNPADPDDPILSDAVRRRHLAAIAADPRNLLDDAAKRRISGARDRAALIQMRAVVEAETRYPSDSEQARIVLAEGDMAAAREVLPVLMTEFRAAGKSGPELAQIMRDEIDGLELSLELTSNQRYLLGQELAIYHYSEPPAAIPPALEPEVRTKEAEKVARKAARYTYKTECKAHGVTVTDRMIGLEVKPDSKDPRTIVQKWSSCDERYQGYDHAILRVFRDKPHLKQPR